MVSEREALVDIIWQTTKVLSPVNEAIADAILTSGILTARSADAWDQGYSHGIDQHTPIALMRGRLDNPYRALLDAAPAGGAE